MPKRKSLADVNPYNSYIKRLANKWNTTVEDVEKGDQSNVKVKGKRKLKYGGIYIKPENRGKFTELKNRTGKSSSWFKEHGTPAQKKMATFALNARKWNK